MDITRKEFNDFCKQHDHCKDCKYTGVDCEMQFAFEKGFESGKVEFCNTTTELMKLNRKIAIEEFAEMMVAKAKKVKYIRHIWIEQTCREITKQLLERSNG